MTDDAYIKLMIAPEAHQLVMISNDGDCVDRALEVLHSYQNVEGVEIYEAGAGTDYIPPSNVSETNDMPEREYFKYAIFTREDLNPQEVAADLGARFERAITRSGRSCQISFSG